MNSPSEGPSYDLGRLVGRLLADKSSRTVIVVFLGLVFLAAGLWSFYPNESEKPAGSDITTPATSSLPTVSPLPTDSVKLLAEAKAYAFNSEPEQAIRRLERIPATSAQYKEAQSLLANLKKGSEVGPPETSANSKDYTTPGSTTPGSITSEPEPDNPLAHSDLYLTTTEIKNGPLEYKLAFLDGSEPIKGNDINAARIRYLLNNIARSSGDGPGQIADQTARATVVLKSRYGKAVTNRQFLEEANDYYSGGGPKEKYYKVSVMLIMAMGR